MQFRPPVCANSLSRLPGQAELTILGSKADFWVKNPKKAENGHFGPILGQKADKKGSFSAQAFLA